MPWSSYSLNLTPLRLFKLVCDTQLSTRQDWRPFLSTIQSESSVLLNLSSLFLSTFLIYYLNPNILLIIQTNQQLFSPYYSFTKILVTYILCI